MSELKATTVYDAYWKANSTGEGTGTLVYLKSEADKAIAEKDRKNAELKDKCQMHDFFWEGCGFKKLGFKNSIAVRDYCDELKRQNKDLLQKCRKANRELRHQKFKRCLAMARWCERKRIDAADYRITREKWEFYDKWHKRWLELAEQFKEVP